MEKLPKIWIGPMSKNVVDSVIELNEDFPIGLIPSRRQVEYTGGYVNKWTTEEFTKYVKSKNPNVLICRDHGGPGQGTIDDDGLNSMQYDYENFDLIHIDPWKAFPVLDDAITQTANMINICCQHNQTVKFEIGTEQAICPYTPQELDTFIGKVRDKVGVDNFSRVVYAVVQSGTGLDLPNGRNTGKFDSDKLLEFIKVCKKYNVLSKEHNGDFLTPDNGIQKRFALGLDAINIAPEMGQIESITYILTIERDGKYDLGLNFANICEDSGKWKKWLTYDSQILSNKELIKTAGHYVLSDERFINNIKPKFVGIDSAIKLNIKQRLNEIYEQSENNSI